jgi:hypothetical protein
VTGPEASDAPLAALGRGPAFWAGAVVGSGVVAYGIVGLVGAAPATRPGNLLAFLVGSALVHDLVLAPVVVIVGWLIARILPGWARPPVWFALAATGLLVVLTWPLVRRWGERPANPSLLPLDYSRNLVAALVVVWLVAGADLVRRVAARRRAPR